MSTPSVRPLADSDLDRFAAMVVRYYEDDPGSLPMDLVRARRQAEWVLACRRHAQGPPELPAAWAARVSAFVIEEGGEAVGYAIVVPYFSNEFGGPIVYLDEFFVERAARGRGVGAAFLAWMIAWARREGLVRIELEVHDANEGAARLYARAGFTREARALWGIQLGEER